MRSPLPMHPRRPVEKALTSRMVGVDSTTPFLEADTHHQDRANMLDNKQPSNNEQDVDHDIWDRRGRALAVEAGPIGPAVRTARALEHMNQQTVS